MNVNVCFFFSHMHEALAWQYIVAVVIIKVDLIPYHLLPSQHHVRYLDRPHQSSAKWRTAESYVEYTSTAAGQKTQRGYYGYYVYCMMGGETLIWARS